MAIEVLHFPLIIDMFVLLFPYVSFSMQAKLLSRASL